MRNRSDFHAEVEASHKAHPEHHIRLLGIDNYARSAGASMAIIRGKSVQAGRAATYKPLPVATRTGDFSSRGCSAVAKPDKYIGINNDLNGGMTPIGKMIRDAWVFELIPETETCEGWIVQAIDALLDKVNAEWDKYGCLVSNLPEELRERHRRIHDEAIRKAMAAGWSGESETDDEG